MKYYKTVGVSFAYHNEWMSYLDYNAYLIDTKVNKIIKIDKTDTQGLYIVTLESGDKVELSAMNGIDFYELEAGETPRLFTPETMKEEYHKAFSFHLSALALRPELEAIIRATRQDAPDVYMSLATLAYEFKSYGLQLGVRLYFDTKGIE